jgi:hypothetical protein
MPKSFLSPRHPDDTPDQPTLMLHVGGTLREERDANGRLVRYSLDPAGTEETSPLRRALRIALRHRPRRTKEN